MTTEGFGFRRSHSDNPGEAYGVSGLKGVGFGAVAWGSGDPTNEEANNKKVRTTQKNLFPSFKPDQTKLGHVYCLYRPLCEGHSLQC